MKATRILRDLGQSLWLDNITRDLLNSGTLKRYLGEPSVSGLTSKDWNHGAVSFGYPARLGHTRPPGGRQRLCLSRWVSLVAAGRHPPKYHPCNA